MQGDTISEQLTLFAEEVNWKQKYIDLLIDNILAITEEDWQLIRDFYPELLQQLRKVLTDNAHGDTEGGEEYIWR